MRLRFAPSPTGFLHIGNARTAIINHIYAQKTGSQLILRVEDTDMERSSKESEQSILADLKWLGIEWVEGPDLGGENGPYRQSERFDIYKQYTEKLIAEGNAYYCYCTAEEVDEMRKEAQASGSNESYNGHCRNLSPEEIEKYKAEGRKPTVRFKVPENKTVAFTDLMKGEVSFDSANIGGDFIIVRSDGVPVYNYIVVIDDLLMKISHVIRGEDHLSNTPKQILIADALGFEKPQYAHMPLIMGEDRKKLSKRHGITSVNLYREEGYLPEALVNYIAMLGWASESGEEILPFKQMTSEFDLGAISKSAAIFDFKKLKWMNGNYIRSKSNEELLELFRPYIEKAGYSVDTYDREWFLSLIELLKKYCELLSDIQTQLPLFLEKELTYSEDALALFASEEGKTAVSTAHELFKNDDLKETFASDFVNLVKEKTGLKGKKLFMPCRTIITGSQHGPDLEEVMRILGYDTVKNRVEQAYKRIS